MNVGGFLDRIASGQVLVADGDVGVGASLGVVLGEGVGQEVVGTGSDRDDRIAVLPLVEGTEPSRGPHPR